MTQDKFVHTVMRLLMISCLAGEATLTSARADERYPTNAIAEYVYLCMKANGETKDTLDRCSCSIDVISSLVPYNDYVAAETFQRMAQLAGDKGAPFRGTVGAKQFGSEIHRAQVEADVRCF